MRNNLKWIVLLLLIAGGGCLFYEKVYIPKATYDYVTAKKGDLTLEVFGIGTVSAKNIHPVSSNYGGKLLEVKKDQGEWVKKGEVVAVLDPVDLPQQLAQAEALLQKAIFETEASLKELEGLYAQKELAELTYRRYDRLYKKGYAAQAEYDKARTDLASVRSQIAASKARIASSRAEQKRARKNIAAIKERIDRLVVVAPLDGYVISKDAEAAQTIAPQQPIVTVVDPANVWIESNVDERISGGVEVGQKARIVLRSREHEPLKGRVARIEAKSDPVTEERIVDVAFEKVPIPFYINEQAETYIETGRLENVTLLPSRVIVHDGVWVYRNGEAHFVKVKILGRNGETTAVEGIGENAIVLVPDPHKKPLFDGVDVRI
jgi:RND family efflux transporter MFP subunit